MDFLVKSIDCSYQHLVQTKADLCYYRQSELRSEILKIIVMISLQLLTYTQYVL